MIILKFIFKQLKTQNMMKKILQLIVVLLIATQGVMAQTVQIESVVEPPGDILVQVDMLSFTDVAAITLKIGYDSDLMDFTGIDDTQLSGSWLANATGDVITVTYMALPPTGFDIDGKAFDLMFDYHGGFSSDLVFDSGNCEIANSGLGLISATYIDGMVEQSTAVGTVSMDMLVENPGDLVSMPLNIEGTGFGSVASMTYMIAFDEFQLTYAGVVEDGITGVTASASNGMLTINWTGAGTDFTTLTHLLDIQFTYHGGDADVEFAAGCEVNNDSFAALAVDYTDGQITPTPGTASLSLSTAAGTPLENVNVPVMAADFGSDVLGAITMVVSYDNSLMSFTGITEQQLNGWVVNVTGAGEITLNWSAVGGGTLSDGSMMTLNFVFGGSAGEAEIFFEPGSIVKDVNLATYPISFNDGIIITTFEVSGQLTYFGDAVRPIFTSTVYLKNAADSTVAYTTTTDANGDFSFADVVNGSYFLDGATTIDATLAYDMTDAFVIFGIGGTLTGLQALASDVNDDGSVDMTDAFIVYGSFLAGNVKVGAWIAPDWFFENTVVTVNDAAVSQDFGAIASGDATASFVPIP